MTGMRLLRALLLASPLAVLLAQPSRALDLENTLYIDLKDGRVVIELLPDLAPTHVARIKELARSGFYDGIVFHRVIAGFMAQTGDPTGTGSGGSGQRLKAEFNSAPHLRGTVSMARSRHPDSADSQFFIVYERATHLDGQYTVWGRVVEGMQFVDGIKKGSAAGNGAVDDSRSDRPTAGRCRRCGIGQSCNLSKVSADIHQFVEICRHKCYIDVVKAQNGPR